MLYSVPGKIRHTTNSATSFSLRKVGPPPHLNCVLGKFRQAQCEALCDRGKHLFPFHPSLLPNAQTLEGRTGIPHTRTGSLRHLNMTSSKVILCPSPQTQWLGG